MGAEVLERPLSIRQLKDLLHVQEGVVLVGGQALAFWADYYDAIGAGFEAGLTKDLDFLGNKEDALEHIASLESKFPNALRYRIATMDTPPPTAAVILIDAYYGPDEPLVIDYVTALAGYDLNAERKMLQRAVDIRIDDLTIKCMHPFDCLKSRAHNLVLLPSKRTELGVEQCATAIRVARQMLLQVCETKEWPSQREIALPMTEAIIKLAAHRHGLEIRRKYNLDLTSAIPVEALCEPFQDIRWPQAKKYIDGKYERMQKRFEPTSKPA